MSESTRKTTAVSDKPRCGAQKRQGEPGDTCTQIAGWGTDHVGYGYCRTHGGNTRTHRQAAATKMAEAEARRALANLDANPIGDPLEALLKLAGQVVNWQEATATLVNDLDRRIRYEGASGAEQLRAEVALYERAMDRAEKVLSSIARLNIEERLAQISEAQADRVIAAIDAALAAVGLGGPEANAARQAAARHLRSV